MIRKFLRNGSVFLTKRQTSILSAATVIMLMIAASRILGLIRNRVLAHFFPAEILSVYFAAFRLPEVIFEVLIFGALSSAFIPVFTVYLSRGQKKEAWQTASVSLNFAILIFLFLAIFFFFSAGLFYQLIAPGFDSFQIKTVVRLTKWLLLAQGFFIISYFLTGVLESFQRFLVPAIAPLFYNLGIILGTYFLTERLGILAPTIGAIIGAFFHFFIQLPLAVHLGFRPKIKLDFFNPGLRAISRLAFPRIIELFFLQISKSAELFLASLVSPAAYTYYTFANSLQFLPIGLFGVSIAKASLPALSYQSVEGNLERFKENLTSLFKQIIFLIIPFSVFLIVLRIPIIRLVFGASRFSWESTLQTGYTLSAFSLGIFAQALIHLLTRAFYALHDTKTPVKASISAIFLNIILGGVFILIFRLPIWSLALAFSCAAVMQFIILFSVLAKKLPGFQILKIVSSFWKITFASLITGGVMYFLLRFLDRSAWDKKLSFFGRADFNLPAIFDRFIFDTRYVSGLIGLTLIVGVVGLLIYLGLSWIFGVKEFISLIAVTKKFKPRLPKEKESVTITPI